MYTHYDAETDKAAHEERDAAGEAGAEVATDKAPVQGLYEETTRWFAWLAWSAWLAAGHQEAKGSDAGESHCVTETNK